MKITEIINEGIITAYHGTGQRFDQFRDNSVAGNYFTQNPEYAKGYVGKAALGGKRGRNYLITVQLTINHPFDSKNDPGSVQFFNEQFLPTINQINAKYGKPVLNPIGLGTWVSFIIADDLYRYMRHYGSQGYDAIYVDEGGLSPNHPAIVPLSVQQIKIVKRQIIT